MSTQLNILGINGSASKNASNLAILKHISQLESLDFNMTIIDDLSVFPPFKTELTSENIPASVGAFRAEIEKADGIVICTPEYVFSIPSGLKNALEWCVSTTVFSDKPVALITAAASGEKGHDQLKLIMKTIQTLFTSETELLIQGVKGKLNASKKIIDQQLQDDLTKLTTAFKNLIIQHSKN